LNNADQEQNDEEYDYIVLESSSLPIVRINKGGGVVYANTKAKEWFMDIDLSDKSVNDLFSGGHIPLDEVLGECINGSMSSQHDSYVGHKVDKTTELVHIFVMPVIENNNHTSQIVITEQKEYEDLYKGESDLSRQEEKKDADVTLPKMVLDSFKKKDSGKVNSDVLVVKLDNMELLNNANLGIGEVKKEILKVVKNIFQTIGDSIEINSEGVLYAIIDNIDVPTANKLLSALSGKMDHVVFDAENQIIQMSTSICLIAVDEKTTEQLFITRSKKTIEKATKKGINSWHIFDVKEELAELASTGDSIALVKHALYNGGFRLQFQPVISLAGCDEEHYAVLLRIIDPDSKLIVAGSFIKEVEKTAMIAKVDRWVILQSIKKSLLHKQNKGKVVNLFIHLSPVSLKHDNDKLISWIKSVAEKLPVDMGSLVFQFTEKNTLLYREEVLKFILYSKKIGFKTCICDFGLIQKPLKNVEEIETDYVRFSSGFVENIESNPDVVEKVTEANKALKKLGRKTIAIPVENSNVLSAFWHAEIDFVLGYFVQKPKSDLDYDFESE